MVASRLGGQVATARSTARRSQRIATLSHSEPWATLAMPWWNG
jgi:hypothetical protein